MFRNLKSIIMVSCLAATLSGCGLVDRKIASFKGVSEMCVDGVVYLQFTSGASVKYNQEGKIVLCK